MVHESIEEKIITPTLNTQKQQRRYNDNQGERGGVKITKVKTYAGGVG